MAAPTIVKSGNFITISAITEDVDHAEIFKDDGLKKIKRFEFQGGANNDLCIIKYGSDGGAIISVLGVADADEVDRCYFEDGGQYMDIYIDFSAGVFTGTHKLIIELA